MLTPIQTKMARAALGWSTAELARRAGVGISTVSRFETGQVKPVRANIDAMQRALEAAGIEFVENGAALRTGRTTMMGAVVQRSSAQVAEETRQQARAEFTEKLQDAIHDKSRVQPKPKHRE